MSVLKIREVDQLKSVTDVLASGAVVCDKFIFLHDMLIAQDYGTFKIFKLKADHVPFAIQQFDVNDYDVIPQHSCFDWF